MKDTTKKVVILNNLSSPYICEAIIVLKKYNPQLESKVIAEAEKIVGDYMEKMNKNGQTPKKSVRGKGFLVMCLAAAVAAVCILSYKLIAG